MDLNKVRQYCNELKSKGNYSIAPKDIRLSQRVTALLVPELLDITENILKLKNWSPEECLKLQGIIGYRNNCNCTLCILITQANHITR
jgi:hypothetical protein